MTALAPIRRGGRSGARASDESRETAGPGISTPGPIVDRRARTAGYVLLGLLAYVPVMLTATGKVAADTKQYLYLDPGRLMSRAWSMWDPNVGMGTVTHQTIGYLFPMGPFYWVFHELGAPAWVAQRIWLGSLLFAAALGMLFLFRTLGVRGPGVVVGTLAFMLTPYTLDYAARISVILLPWCALPWMVGLVIRGLRTGGWKHAAIFAIVIQIIGGVNATALLFAGLAPALWIPYAVWVTRDVDWRRGLSQALKIGGLTIVTSLWWISGLWAQGSYGLDILKFTETLQAVSKTSLPNEVLRGLGYWFFYGRDKLGPWIEASVDFTQRPWLIVVSYAIPVLALLSAAVVRWRHRAYFVLITLLGVVIAVGAHPYDSSTPIGAAFKKAASSSTAAFALRSSGRATPLVVLGVATLLGIGVNACVAWLRRSGLHRQGLAVAILCGAIVVAGMPALWDGTWYGKNLQRPEAIPSEWTQALSYLDAQPHSTRVMAMPGSDFASYTWGNTVDPIAPGLMDRDFVARELIPYGSPASADMLDALDERLQEGLLPASAIAPMARLMNVGDILVRNDMQYERYRLIRPQLVWQLFSPAAPGLAAPKDFGTPGPVPTLRYPFHDETYLADPTRPNPPPVATVAVPDAPPMVRAQSPQAPVIVAGSGDGLVSAAAAGVLAGNPLVLYSASFGQDSAALRAAVARGATLVLTDTNRQRALRWSTVYDNTGYTEGVASTPLGTDPSDARLDVFPDESSDAKTVTVMRGIKGVSATDYGNPITYTPEDRPARAVDGDPNTGWKVGAFAPVQGEEIRLTFAKPITTDHVNLTQLVDQGLDRHITGVTLLFDGRHGMSAKLDKSSWRPSGDEIAFPKRTFSTFTVRIDHTNGDGLRNYSGISPVGFGEIRLSDDMTPGRSITGTEAIRLPEDLLRVAGKASLGRPLVLLMNRERVVPVPPRYDPELYMDREFTLPTARDFSVGGTATLSSVLDATQTDQLLGYPDPTQGGVVAINSAHLPGDAATRASAALDGDPSTAWTTPLDTVTKNYAQYTFPTPVSFDHLNLQVIADGNHSVPTEIEVMTDLRQREVIDLPPIADSSTPNAVTTIPVNLTAPMSGRIVTFTIRGIRPVTSEDFYCECQENMPMGIAEWGIANAPTMSIPTQLPAVCRTDLVTIDGRPVPVTVTGSVTDAEANKPLTVTPCNPDGGPAPPIRLGPGVHHLVTQQGNQYGLDVDTLTLASAAGGASAPVGADGSVDMSVVSPVGAAVAGVPASSASTLSAPPTATTTAVRSVAAAPPKLTVTSSGRVKTTVRVSGATGPFWLVLGQSFNAGFHATLDGRSLGAPTLVNGYANGWLVSPPAGGGPFTVTMEWTPQRVVDAALGISLVGLLACLVLVLGAIVRRRRRGLVYPTPREGSAVPTVGSSGVGHEAAAAGGPADSGQVGGPYLWDHDDSELVIPNALDGPRPGRAGTAIAVAIAVVGGAIVVTPWVGLLTGAATVLVLARPRWRLALRAFPFVALAVCGAYIAAKEWYYAIPASFEWPTFFSQVRTFAWLAVVLFAVDAVIELFTRRYKS